MTGKPRIKLPDTIRAGDVIEVKTLVSHVMETGQRKDKDGNIVPRNVINTFTVTFDGREVFRAKLSSGISANPFISFFMQVPGQGALEFLWIDDRGQRVAETVPLNIA